MLRPNTSTSPLSLTFNRGFGYFGCLLDDILTLGTDSSICSLRPNTSTYPLSLTFNRGFGYFGCLCILLHYILKHSVPAYTTGIGKTTLIHKACQTLKQQGVPLQGFYTEELRDRGQRIGFDVVTLDGHRGQLARIG